MTGTDLTFERPKLLRTSVGTNTGAFGPGEWGLLAGIALIWGSSFLWIELGLLALRPGVVTFLRLLLGAATLAVIPRARRRIEREDVPRTILLGVAWMGVPLTIFPIAQQWVDSSVAGMMNGTVPIMTAVWSVALLGRVPRSRQLAGVLVGFGGLVAIMWPNLSVSSASARGVLLLLGAVVLYGLAANLAVPLQQRYGALPVLLRAQLVALVVVTPLGIAHLPGSSWEPGALLAMVPLGVLGTGLAFVALTTLVGRAGGVRGSVAVYFTPVVAIALGVAFLGEALHVLSVVGTALVLAGAWLTSRRE